MIEETAYPTKTSDSVPSGAERQDPALVHLKDMFGICFIHQHFLINEIEDAVARLGGGFDKPERRENPHTEHTIVENFNSLYVELMGYNDRLEVLRHRLNLIV